MTLDDRELNRRLDSLTRRTEPDEGLWPGIERRLHPARRRPAAAAVVAVVGIGGLLVALSVLDGNSSRAPSLAQVEADAMRTAAPETLPVSRGHGSTALLEAWQDNQAAIYELEQALERDPDNRLLLEFLSEARLRQARLIQRSTFPPERSI